MTDIRTLATIDHEIDQAQEDIALEARLKSAAARLKGLTAERVAAQVADDAAKAARVKAEELAAQAASDARFAGLSDLRITEIPDAHSTSVLSSRFNIAFTRDSWNGDYNVTVAQPVAISGFRALDSEVFAWIVERHPDKVPASIMSLAPGDVDEAFNRYFVASARGYLTA